MNEYPRSDGWPRADLERRRSLRGLKVALFTGNYNYLKEGANQALNMLVAHLESRLDATVRVFSPVTATPAFKPRGTLIPVPSIALPGRPELQLALGLPRAARAAIRAFAPDLVHVATPDILCSRAMTFARSLRTPVVASLHTHFETYCDYYGLGWLRPAVEWHLERFYRRSDMILVPTPSILETMARRHGHEKMRIWGRGVDSDLFAPARRSTAWRESHGLAADEIALTFFGRLVVEKGTAPFAEVVETLRAEGHRVRAVIIGEGPAREQLGGQLPHAIFTGHLTGVPLATAIARTDILINPSLTETFGNVTLEAMACGLAVVAADAPSTHNLAVDGVSALISPPSARDYAARVRRLLADPALRSLVSRGARSAALHWRWEQVLDTVVENYGVLLDRHDAQANRKTIS